MPQKRVSPSNALPRPGALGEPVRIGETIRPHNEFPETVMGDAVHTFFATDTSARAS